MEPSISTETDTRQRTDLASAGWVLPIALFLLVLLQAAAVAVQEQAISPYDEAAHFDYVVQLQRGNFPVPAGQRLSEEAMQEWACRPTDRATGVAFLCGVHGSASDARVPFGGINYEAPFGPIYYVLAALGSSLLGVIGVADFTGARLVSATLHALGAGLLGLVALRMAISPTAAGGLILGASATGLALSMGATITPDSMAFLGAAAVIASAILAPRWFTAMWLTTLVGAVAGLTKPNFIVIAVLGSIILFLRWMSIERPRLDTWTAGRLVRTAVGIGLPVVACATAAVGWAALSAARNQTGAPSDGGAHLFLQSPLGPMERLVGQLWAFLRPDGGTAPGAAFTVLDTPLLRALGLGLVVATLGASVVAWLWTLNRDRRNVLLLRAVSLTIPICAVLFVAILWITYQGGHQTASRYALPLFAAATVGLGGSVGRRAAVPVALMGFAVWLVAWIAILG